MLTQVTNNYSVLQMQVASVMEQRQKENSTSSQEKKPMINGTRLLLKSGEEQSNSSSEDKTISGSPTLKNKRAGREESPESAQKKYTKTNSDQSVAEATMRKARVSVRARSEASMVSNHI